MSVMVFGPIKGVHRHHLAAARRYCAPPRPWFSPADANCEEVKGRKDGVSNPVVSEDEEDAIPELYRDDIDESVDEDNNDDDTRTSSPPAVTTPAFCRQHQRKTSQLLLNTVEVCLRTKSGFTGCTRWVTKKDIGTLNVPAEATGCVDKPSVHTGLKNALGWTGVNRSSTWNLVVKYVSYKNKVHTKQGMICYCHKNVNNYEHPVFRSNNVSEKDIQTGLATYLPSVRYFNNKIVNSDTEIMRVANDDSDVPMGRKLRLVV
ncbi:hypothetical protein CYMTET_9101 [Cymbomonas tetramitiformis]|uniref:Uncharacterized protein n=1 Tax=Cymbomonas tetramitiformis TaxID=36881 RepID=A0AAE0GTI1_9CHLO|nr:hypothetical protein CYMTET_9101 [Cymbomonas tetramitiformis]